MTGISKFSGTLTEEEKEEKLREYKDHLDKAKTQKDQCEEAKSVFTRLDKENRNRGKYIFFLIYNCEH